MTDFGTFKRSGIPVPVGFTGCEFGDTWFVDYGSGSDSYLGKTPGTAFKTYSKAYGKATTNQNDAILVNGSTEVVETAMIDFTKSRVHTFGCNGPFPGAGYGPGARISLGVTTAAADIATLKNTGVRNTFNGIKFSNSNTLATNLYTVAEGGEYTRYNHCEIYKSGLLTTDLTAPLLMNGDSSQFYGCTIGDLVNTRGASGKECPCIMLAREQISGKVCRDGWFEDCRILTKAAHVDVCFVYGTGATDVERSLVFKNSMFFNAVLAVADPANAVNFGAAQTEGQVLLMNPTGIGLTYFGGGSLGVFVVGVVPTENTSGISVQITT